MGSQPALLNPTSANPAFASSFELVVRAQRTREGMRVGAERASGA